MKFALPSFLIVLFAISFVKIDCFVPAKLITFILENAGSAKIIEYGQVSETIVHENLLRRGAIASVAQYLMDQKKNGSRVTRSNLTRYYDVSLN